MANAPVKGGRKYRLAMTQIPVREVDAWSRGKSPQELGEPARRVLLLSIDGRQAIVRHGHDGAHLAR
jgi:hypothetical protein